MKVNSCCWPPEKYSIKKSVLSQHLNVISLHRPHHSIDTLDAALQEVENIPAYLPNCLQLKDVVTKAKKWLHEAETLQVSSTYNT